MPWLPPRLPSLPSPVLLPVLPAPAPEVSEPPDAEAPAEPAEAPDASSDFFAFFSFFTFFLAFGFSSDAPLVASVPEEPEVADGEVDELPLVALGLDEVEPDALLPVVPEAPDDVSLEPELPLADVPLPDAPEDDMPLLPEEPDVLPDGIALELPLALPVSLPGALCERVVEEGVVSLAPLVALLCASAMEDTDATTTNDRERRVVFNVMSNSLLLNERHHRCSSLDAGLACAFSKTRRRQPSKSLMF